MKSLFAAVLLVTSFVFVSAQEPEVKLSKEAKAYAQYRLANVEPPFGLAKIKAMIARVKEDEDMNRRITDAQFNALSTKEKFTYTMIHGEDFDQNCADMSPIDERNKIFAHAPGNFDYSGSWSKRQMNFLEKNRIVVLGLIRSLMKSRHRVGVTFKNAIWSLDGYGLIPDLIAVYKRDRKDKDILSILMSMMNDHSYAPFTDSKLHKALYGNEDNWFAFIPATPQNERAILSFAQGYYQSRKRR